MAFSFQLVDSLLGSYVESVHDQAWAKNVTKTCVLNPAPYIGTNTFDLKYSKSIPMPNEHIMCETPLLFHEVLAYDNANVARQIPTMFVFHPI